MIGGVIANTGYGIAIYALVLGPMAHVAALRETSVLFGALMGTLLLGEPFGLRRVAAAFVIVSGLVLMNGPALFWRTTQRDRSTAASAVDWPPAVQKDFRAVPTSHPADDQQSFGDE